MNEQSTAKLQEALKGDLTDYQAIPFWSWNNELDEEILVKQIEEMKEAGMGGFIMHARTGLKTEYLGEKWFSCVDACLKKAKELGMNAWIYDENGWPSGFVGGKLLENEAYRAQFLEYEVKSEYDETAFAVYERTTAGFIRLHGNLAGVNEYHCVYLRTSPANSDILNPEVVDEFIRQTHEEYYKRFADSFGKELVGFFTDEPQYYRWGTPYTRAAAAAYKEKYGKDIRDDGLVYLFLQKDEHGYPFRQRYYRILNELYTLNFYKKLYDWCDEHGCKLTGHSVEEVGLHTQMWGGAGCMPSYEYEHIPGMDCLGRECSSELAPRQVGSVASQLGIKQTLTETFGCAGYDVTPQELKSLGEYQFFNGINLMCHHLYPYSLAGQGKHDHPPVFSKHGNWWEEFRVFNDHFTKLGYIVANTKENCDVLLVNPMRSVYLDYVRSVGYDSVKELEDRFGLLLKQLRDNGVQYQLADEWLLEKYGKAEDGKVILGQCEYTTVIVPFMPTISHSTLELLNAYTGKLLLLSTPKYVDGKKEKIGLTSNVTFDDVLANTQVKFRCLEGYAGMTSRTGELGDYIFIKNYSHTDRAVIKTEGIADTYKALDLETFALKNISDEYILPKCESLILIKDETARAETKKQTVENVTEAFAVTGVTENYLVMDYASLSFDGENFGEKMPLPQLFEQLLRADYKGNVYVRHTFTVNGKTPVKLIMEKTRLLSAKLNGKDVAFTTNAFDFNFVEADVTDMLVEGENVFVYGVAYSQHEGVHFALFDPLATESLRNCLYYDTHIENVYLKGDFVVNADMSIGKREELPALASDNYKNGYPFFKGELTLEGEYEYDGEGERSLSLIGRFAVAQLCINGKKTDLTLDTQKDVTSLLTVGKNKIVITLRSSLRNLFGPHHYIVAEPMGVSPVSFTMRGTWGEGVSPDYTHEYHSVPFGVDRIEMLRSE